MTVKGWVQVRFSPEVEGRLRTLAAAEDRSLSWVVRRLVHEALAAQGEPVVVGEAVGVPVVADPAMPEDRVVVRPARPYSGRFGGRRG